MDLLINVSAVEISSKCWPLFRCQRDKLPCNVKLCSQSYHLSCMAVFTDNLIGHFHQQGIGINGHRRIYFHKVHCSLPFTSEQTANMPSSVLNRNDGRTPNVSRPTNTFPLLISTRQNENTPSRLLAISSAPPLAYKCSSTSPSLSVSSLNPCSFWSWNNK